ncbi:hypothetical protein ACIPYS_04715 [Kitasatospora sp. NPDC089913]|uniref:hypothetical protein n=1 Tax=Streptomycetaceae TaxID=2062 RepID=UPI000879580E|nr:hypothetical protein [Streptomyces sp. TLI_053]SDT82149.1 hypothetical protein SAMN05216371_6998 [Streptomyces sp. TLI_053]
MHNHDERLTLPHTAVRPGETADHPAGEIRLRAGGGLGLRSNLLAGTGGAIPPIIEFPTMTTPF